MATTNNKSKELTAQETIKEIVSKAVEDENAKVVFVLWHDAVAHANWHEPDAAVSECTTIGYLAGASEFAIEVASTISDGNEINASIVIPIGMIVSVKEIIMEDNNSERMYH